jgi:HhH-GPD superfamily base excision DNA repair protein
MTLHITGDDAADRLLTDDPLALLIGMLLDQQVAMETAFAGPLKIRQRVGSVDAATLAHYDPDGATVLKRLKALPGFGEQKAKIFLALLGKQYGYTGDGWREAAGAYGEEGSFRSVADIVSPESLTKVREHKRAMKAAAKSTGAGA